MAVTAGVRRAASMVAVALGLCAGQAMAQEPAPTGDGAAATVSQPEVATSGPTKPEPAQEAVTAAPPATVPAGTLIEIRIDEAVNSKTHKTGDWYAISLAQPIMLGDRTLVPAGTPGRGQVVHAAKPSWGGKAGELILAARYLEFQEHRIGLRGMKLGGVGGNNEGLAFATSVAGGLAATPLIFAINGKNADIPAGMLATAKLAEPLAAEGPAAETPAAAPAASDTSSTTETGDLES